MLLRAFLLTSLTGSTAFAGVVYVNCTEEATQLVFSFPGASGNAHLAQGARGEDRVLSAEKSWFVESSPRVSSDRFGVDYRFNSDDLQAKLSCVTAQRCVGWISFTDLKGVLRKISRIQCAVSKRPSVVSN